MRLAVAIFLFTLIAGVVSAQEDKWLEIVQNTVRENPDQQALGRFAAAYKSFDPQPFIPLSKGMSTIINEGWNQPHAEVSAALGAQSQALTAIYNVAWEGPVALPKQEGTVEEMIVPNFLKLQLIGKAMASAARYHQSQGNLDLAAGYSIATVRFGEILHDDSSTLIGLLIGMAIMKFGADTTLGILQDPRITAEIASKIGSEMLKIDRRFDSAADAFDKELAMILASAEQVQSDPAFKQKLIEEMGPEAEKMLDQLPGPDDLRQAKSIIGEYMAKPYWERSGQDVKNLLPENLQEIAMPNANEADTRNEVARTSIRLCTALAAIKSGKPELAAQLQDPFTGEKLKINANIPYSLGPDGQDQQAQTIYDPTNGTVSAGDIVGR